MSSSIDHADLETAIRRGQVLLDKLQHAEAESVFRDVLRRVKSSELITPKSAVTDGTDPDLERQKADRVVVAAVAGLAETFARYSRSASRSSTGVDGVHDVADWMRLMVHGLSLHRDAADLARLATSRHGSRLKHEDLEFFKDVEATSSNRSRILEDTLVNIVKDQVLTINSRTSRPTSDHFSNPDGNNNESSSKWLRTFLSRCSESESEEETIRSVTIESLSPTSHQISSPLVSPVEQRSEPLKNTDEVKGRGTGRIDFDRIQKTIRRLVDEASSDVRLQYGHLVSKGIASQTLLQRRVASELIARLARSRREGEAIETALEDIFVYDEQRHKEDRRLSVKVDENECVTLDLSEDSSESESDSEPGDYETLYLDCPASNCDLPSSETALATPSNEDETQVELSTPAKASTAGSQTAVHGNGLKHPSEDAGETSPEVAEYSAKFLNAFQMVRLNPDSAEKEPLGIITIWKSYGSTQTGTSANDVTKEEKQCTDQQQKPPTGERRSGLSRLQSFEEVSALTERDRVFHWLKAVDLDCPPARTRSLPSDGLYGDTTILTSSKLSQTIGFVSLGVAESLRNEAHFREACDVYKYALGIFQDHPLIDGGSSLYIQLVADLLRDIGIVKCCMGEMAAGCQLMEESMSLYAWRPASEGNKDDVIRSQQSVNVARVWYQLGNLFLSDELRGESLLDFIMHAVQAALGGHNGRVTQTKRRRSQKITDTDTSSEGKSSDSDDDDVSSVTSFSDCSDTYSVCTQEAVSCYQRVLEILDAAVSVDRSSAAELYASTLARLADCYLLTNQFQRSIEAYERSLPHFNLASLGLTSDRRRETALLNAHVLGQLGTANFLVGNFTRAAMVYELSVILRHRLADAPSDTADNGGGSRSAVCLEAAWTRSMYGLTLAKLGRDNQCVLWSLRAFTDYVRVLRSQIIAASPRVRRWFVVETLFTIANSYVKFDQRHHNAVHYLTIAKNMLRVGPEEKNDIQQTFKVLMALSESLEEVGDVEEALKYRNEATMLVSSVDVTQLSDDEEDAEDLTSKSAQLENEQSGKQQKRNSSSMLDLPDAASPAAVGITPESVIRDGVASIIGQLSGIQRLSSSESVDEDSILEAEQFLDDTLKKTSSPTALMTSVGDVFKVTRGDKMAAAIKNGDGPEHDLMVSGVPRFQPRHLITASD